MTKKEIVAELIAVEVAYLHACGWTYFTFLDENKELLTLWSNKEKNISNVFQRVAVAAQKQWDPDFKNT